MQKSSPSRCLRGPRSSPRILERAGGIAARGRANGIGMVLAARIILAVAAWCMVVSASSPSWSQEGYRAPADSDDPLFSDDPALGAAARDEGAGANRDERVSDGALDGASEAEQADPRRPVGLALSADDRLLYVANQVGTISVVDMETEEVLAEHSLGRQLSAVAWLGDDQLLVTDELADELIQVSVRGSELEVIARLPVSPYPVGLIVENDGAIYVTSLWSHRLTELAVVERGRVEARRILDLPFAPRCLIAAPDGAHLVVADAFSGRLLVIDRRQFVVKGNRKFPSHNVRGLAASVDGQKLVVAHQMLNDLAHTVRNDVHWGLLMSNDLRWLRFDSILGDGSDVYKGGHMHPLGEAGNAAADPTGVVIGSNGTVVVALGGVHEIAVGRERDFSFYRIPVGKRPTAVVLRSDNEQAFVANQFDDSISRIDLPRRELMGHVSLGASRPLTLVERGEQLFYSGRLSHDGWMSCHSCHTDGHSNGGLNDNFSDNSFGAPKRVLSLLGLAGTAPFAWNGEVEELETQIRNSVNQTMQSDRQVSDKNMAAMVAFLESLVPPPSRDELRGTLDEAAVERGSLVFEQRGCVQCHAPPLYTTPDRYDVGLEDSEGNRLFNPPSLRGVGQRGPYFHDNRAESLESVFRDHGHPVEGELTEAEFQDLLAFLRSL
jgi:DNA-binding beta-propeller fold protein YncE/cytochrome c peroxidase